MVGERAEPTGLGYRTLKPGIYAPIPTFFLPESEDLDLPSFETHVVRIAKAGVTPLLAGSMGEAPHLIHEERTILIKAARRALDDAGLGTTPIVAGTGVGSTRETVELCRQAANAGADAVIVIASGYFAGVLGGNKRALKAFWSETATKSPIPVFIYNYPGASGGIDLDSDLIAELAAEQPNLIGVKLTCGNVGKLTRIAASVTEASFLASHPRTNNGEPFLVLGGYADFLLPSAYANGHGAITGLANLAPYTLRKLFDTIERSVKEPALLSEVQELQGIVARADFTTAKASVAGMKSLLKRVYGYGGNPRKPLPPIESGDATALWEHPHTQAIIKVERELTGQIA